MPSDDDPHDPRERARIGSSPDLNRAVYERFLQSDYPEALRLADLVLERDPEDAVARAVRAQCLDAIERERTYPSAHDSGEMLGDEDILEDTEESEALTEDDVHELAPDDVDTAPFLPVPIEETSPTLSLGSRSEAVREVYRLFLASQYAPALRLAEELIAEGEGEEDPMLVSIARECRAVVSTRSSIPELAAPPEMIAHLAEGDVDERAGAILSRVNGSMTIDEVASATGLPVDDVLGLLERFVAMGVLTLRPPPPPR